MIRIKMRKLVNKFPQYKSKIEAAVSKEIRTTTLAIEAGAKVAAPVDTGALRNSIQSETEKLRGRVSVGVEYGPYVEYGTVHQAAHPFLTPVAEEEIGKLQEKLKHLESLL